MNRILAATMCLAVAAPASAAERRYPVTDFDRIVVEGPFIVRLTSGPSSAVASGNQAALDRASIEVLGQTLRIRRTRTNWSGQSGPPSGPIEVDLTTRNVRSVRLIGPGRVELDRASGLRVDLIVEGSGDLRAAGISTDNLSLGLAGAGRLEVAGTAESLTADIQGTGDVEGAGLVAENANITTATTGRVTLGVEETATVTALGLGEVVLVGNPDCTLRGASADLVRCGSDQRQLR